MKFLFDFLPLLLFVATSKYGEHHKDWAAAFASQHFGFMISGGKVGPEEAPILLATLVVMAATLVQVVVLKLRRQKIDLMLWISFVLVTVLGALTVWLHDDTFIKWKPTGIYWASGLAFWISSRFFGHNLIQDTLGKEIELPEAAWRTLSNAWVGFFVAMGALNLYVAYHYSTSVWVDFKFYGTYGLMALFMLAQGFYLGRVLDAAEKAKAGVETSGEH